MNNSIEDNSKQNSDHVTNTNDIMTIKHKNETITLTRRPLLKEMPKKGIKNLANSINLRIPSGIDHLIDFENHPESIC